MSSNVSPYQKLQNEASLFSQNRTDGVKAQVVVNDVNGRTDVGEIMENGNWDFGRMWQYKLYLDGPSGKSSKKVLTVEHPSTARYPVTIIVEPQQKTIHINSEAAFVQNIRQILASKETQAIIESLLN